MLDAGPWNQSTSCDGPFQALYQKKTCNDLKQLSQKKVMPYLHSSARGTEAIDVFLLPEESYKILKE